MTTALNRCDCGPTAVAEQPKKTEGAASGGPWFRAPLDVVETESEVIVRADVPGVAPERVGIHVTGDTLELHAPVDRQPPADARQILAEYGVGDWRRVMRLAPTIDPEGITAKCSSGVLEVRLPKRRESQRRRIAVDAE